MRASVSMYIRKGISLTNISFDSCDDDDDGVGVFQVIIERSSTIELKIVQFK